MSGAKYTPGPWVCRHGLNLFGGEGRLVANCGGHSQNFNHVACKEENKANARLIAAAPALVEALRTVLLEVDTIGKMVGYRESEGDLWAGPSLTSIEDTARAALALVDGGGE